MPRTPAFEVVVADNGSRDDTQAVLARMATALPLVAVRCEQAGKCRALNAGVRAARGALLLFTDDDVLPPADWVARAHAAAATHPEAGIFGGRVRVEAATVPAWVRRSSTLRGVLTSEHERGDAAGFYTPHEAPFGPCMMVRAELLRGIAEPFPVHIGPGTTVPVGDEGVFVDRVVGATGTRVLYVPDVVVTHEVEARSVTFAGALARCWQAGRADALIGRPPSPRLSDAGRDGGLPGLALRRLRGCRSLRELACMGVRLVAYLWAARRRRGAARTPAA